MPDIFISSEEKEKEKKPKAETANFSQTVNPLAAFVCHPSGVRFETQDEEEKIILLLRRHWITNVSWIFLAILLLFAPLVLRSFPLLDFLPVRYQLISLIMWYLLATAFIFERFLIWFFNVFIVTDEQVVDFDFYNLLYKEVSGARIAKIQDVTYKMGGAIRAIFNYGDVFIQTAGTEENFEFLAVPKPDQVKKVLDELMEEQEEK